MSLFHVSGIRRFCAEIFSDAFSFFAILSLLIIVLALPAFDITASGEFNREEDYAVIFQDRHGNEIGRRGIRSDDTVALADMPDFLVKATLATEDRRFYDHFGIDVVGTLRALMSNAQGDSSIQGGSSISQQLAKNLFLSPARTLERKISEAFLAVWLEWQYSKDELLKLYFDRAYMGGGNFGVVAAAEYYFGKRVQDITLAEAAMLSGLFKAPTRYAPHVDLAAARGRASLVLSNMVAAGFLTEGQAAEARRKPATPIARMADADAPNYFLDWAFEQSKQVITNHPYNGNNFVVRTTIDMTLQKQAEETVTSTLREQGERYRVSQAAMVVTDTGGAVRAMVGGADYGKSQFNRAVVSTRQPGSAYKVFVYAEAFEQLGLKPGDTIIDQPVCIGNWCPRNYGRSYKGRVTLASAFAQSLNTVPVTLSIRTGRAPIAELSHRMGLQADYPVTASLALGVASVSVLDMASSYAVLANRGYKTPAYGITRITTPDGALIHEAERNAERERILSETTVVNINTMLRGVITGGTGRRAEIAGVPVVGKSGTTSAYRDAWFCGFTGNYVAAVWFGNDDYSATNNLTGGNLPAIAFQKFMTYAHTNIAIEPVFGVNFTPREIVVATAEPDDAAGAEAGSSSGLTLTAARKLEDMTRRIDAVLQAGAPAMHQASISIPIGVNGL